MANVARLPEAFSDFIVISELQRGVVEKRLPEGAILHRVSNPVEACDLGLKERAASGDFLFVGRIAREKGPLVLAEAARRAGVSPVYVGDGPVAGELARLYPEARILGWREPAEVRERMRAARALVFPSQWYEGQPLTVMEAKALATPVIVSDACAGRESIADGEAGLWFRSGDVDDLADKLVRLRDDVLVERLSAGAYRDYWSNPPTLERHVEAILDIYEHMLARRSSFSADGGLPPAAKFET
jgi:glycosyltransferase involved in cell wall biosynthesis